MVGTDENDSIHRPLIVDSGTGMCQSGIAGFTPHVVFPSLSSGPDARHHGRYGSERQLRGVFSAKSSTFLSVFMVQTAQQIIVILHLLLDEVVNVPVM